MNLHTALTKSIKLHDNPGHSVGLAVFQLHELIKELEVMNKDPLAARHVSADRVMLQRLAIRLLRLASQ